MRNVVKAVLLILLFATIAWAAAQRMPLDGLSTGGCDWASGCTVANLDEDPDGAGTDWAVSTNNNTSHTGHFSFGTPTDPLTDGANLQGFRVSAREAASCGTGTPTLRIELWESNTLIRAGGENNVTAVFGCTQGTDCDVFELLWNATEITTAANVEVKVFSTKAGGAPSVRCAVDIGAVEWNADTTAAPASTRRIWTTQ